MKKHLTIMLSTLLIVSVFVNIFVISNSRRQQAEWDMIDFRLLEHINSAIHQTAFSLRDFIENQEHETLVEVANNLTLLQGLIDTRCEVRNTQPFTRFDMMGSFLINGGRINERQISAIFADGIVDENEISSLTYLKYALWNILFVPSTSIPEGATNREIRDLQAEHKEKNSIAAFNERFNEFTRFLFYPEPQRYNLF